ncbi:unannotated protein [freshwater metagenome]|uniref:Unannotated protein n=1 Tax=freshwater metagenome TaxID=449393 RepID=A0A6J7IA17_9ZZZZ
MLILLAPSEGKAAPPAGSAAVDLGALSHPGLTAQRLELIKRLTKLTAGPQAAALAALKLSAGQAAELERNRNLLAAPAAPAAQVYTGVLYQHLDLASLSAEVRRRAAQRVLIASALWGVVAPDDAIPAYRLSMGARLPGMKGLAAWWRTALEAALPPDGLVVDLRSGAYAAAWRPAGIELVEVGARTPQGKVISHMAKATRGAVARLLLQAGRTPRSAQDVAACVEAAGHTADLRPLPNDRGWALDVIAG